MSNRWLNHHATPENNSLPPTAAADPERIPHVSFEMMSADERFLAEARQLELSPLDTCHYKVVAQLQSSCSDLTEEELAKLAVSLFNCQARAEGRRTYLCTTDLTLAECTAEMDPDTWTAYHIVSNRARAVCYATRQMQFKRQTEHTVNALVSTAVNQLETMKMLKNNQEELKELTSESLQKVASSQDKLLAQQEKLQGSQEQMEESIHSNLDQLAQEKALIASGQQQVARLIEGITRRMENISNHLNNQDMDLQEGHKAILQDLSQVQQRAQEVYSKIDTNLGLFLAYRDQTALYYDEMMTKLQRMNESLGLVLGAMDRMRSNVEGRLQHLQRFINWAGFSLSTVNTCVLHGSYFLLAALIMTFLQIPGLPRATLLVLVVANALSELNHVASLGFKSLTILLVLAVIGNWLLGSICHSALRDILAFLPLPQKASNSSAPAVGLKCATGCHITSTPEREDDDGLWREELEKLPEMSCASDGSHLEQESPAKSGNFFLGEGAVWEVSGGSVYQKHQLVHSVQASRLHHVSLTRPTRHEFPLERLARRHLGSASHPFPSSRDCSPNGSIISDVSNSSASPRLLCQGVTRTGQQCRKKALSGHMFCHIHASGEASCIT
ncbi:protein brambleberry-like [Tiliqua scincoides]|uniref:protein brambleberry-like n=1 Tax=Tiliqua scincoides TaxID=71010 RepID=UPI0034624D58